MKPDLTDLGLRIVSWPTRDADGVIDPTELREKTAALVDALKALEAAAEAMPSGVGLRVRVDVAGQTVIGESSGLFVVLNTQAYEAVDSFEGAFTDEGAAIECCRKSHSSQVVLAALDDPEADWIEVWPRDERAAGGEG